MLETLITSKTRIKLLLKFFLNPGTKAYLRGLADEFGESTNAVRLELNKLKDAGFLETEEEGRTIVYSANKKNNLFPEIHALVKKYLGFDWVEKILRKLGKLEAAFITGDYAKGIDSGLIDLVVVGDINKQYLYEAIQLAEEKIHRKIRPLILSSEEFNKLKNTLNLEKSIVLWNKEKA